MFPKVLIPIDGSELSSRILAPLRRLLGFDSPSQAILFHAHQGAQASNEVQQELLRLAQLCSASGVPGTAKFVAGEPAEAILQAADLEAVDLIAMATHGHSGVTRLVRGSVAERVLRHATAPVLLCNPECLHSGETRDPAFQRILVPFDGSELAARVLPGAAALAQAYDAEVVLLRVENFSAQGAHQILRDIDEISHELQPTVVQLKDLGVKEVVVKVEVGNEIDAILTAIETENIDLLAMASHGRGGVARWWFGSTAEGVIRACPCPVFVTRVASAPH